MYFKDTNNALHSLSDEDIANGGEALLPQGCVPISDADAQQIISIDSAPKPLTPQQQIDALERESMIPRITREFMLAQAVMTAASQNITPDQLYQANIGYRKLKDLDNQIAALRNLIG